MKSEGVKLSDKESIIKRLWRSSETNSLGCRLWTGARSNGYGVVRFKRFGKKYYVHRLSAYVYHGLDIDDKYTQANHKDNLCSGRNCWAPDHIYVGNHLGNIADAIKNKSHNLDFIRKD